MNSSSEPNQKEDPFTTIPLSKENNDNELSSLSPRVVACGYRRVRGGSSFPAWLVYIPIAHQAFWRKRKDIASLASIIKASSTKVPKKALDKLSDEAKLPWCHDDEDDDINDVGLIVRKQLYGDRENKWDSSLLEKPLQRVNQFIKEIHDHVTATDGASLRANKIHIYREFVSWSDVSDVVPRYRLHSKLSSLKTADDEKDNNDEDIVSEKEAKALADEVVTIVSDSNHAASSSSTILLVPNCGSGQVIWALLDRDIIVSMLKKQQQQPEQRHNKLSILATNEDEDQVLICKQHDTTKSTHWMSTSFVESTIPRSLKRDIASCFVSCLARAESIFAHEEVFTRCINTWNVGMFVLVALYDDDNDKTMSKKKDGKAAENSVEKSCPSFVAASDWNIQRTEPRDGIQLVLMERRRRS